ncbi:MAG: fumarylacetoacetate hydrolase family protein [Rhodocyclaceae bacterium]
MSNRVEPQDGLPGPVVFEIAPRAGVPVVGGGVFPVRRIFCIARNYAAHAREMGGDPEREAPFFFTKPADAVLPVAAGATGRIRYPLATQDLHHEVELVVALRAGGENLTATDAAECVWGYAVGIDLTRRDLQAEAKAAGRPWDVAKAFDDSAPISEIRPVEALPEGGVLPATTPIRLSINGEIRQDGVLGDMSWSVPEIIAHLSRYFALAPGDLVFTGTPEGVGPVCVGDLIEAEVEGVGSLRLMVSARPE